MSAALSRRGLLGAIICAPAIVRASSLMPIKAVRPPDLMAALIASMTDPLANWTYKPTTLVIGEKQFRLIKRYAFGAGPAIPLEPALFR